MKCPLVSVAMVTCNAERFLAEAIESILNQTFADFEFIIVDFGSTDGSRAIITSYAAKDNRVDLHEIPKCGLAEARDASCLLGRGQYIAIMDADDIALKDRLAWQVEFMEKHPEVGVLGGATEWIDIHGKPLVTRHYPIEDSEIRKTLSFESPFCNPTVLIRKEVLVSAGGFRKPFVSAEDYDLWLRAAERSQLANLAQVVLRYRIHSSQESIGKVRNMTICALAARLAADRRSSGECDPFNSVDAITPEVLARVGISERSLQNALALQYLRWIGTLAGLGEYAAALSLWNEMFRSCSSKCLEKRTVAEVWLAVAPLYWRTGRLLQSLSATSRAIAARPVVAGRPLMRILRKTGFSILDDKRRVAGEPGKRLTGIPKILSRTD